VESVNWNQATDFCGKLTARDKAKGVGRGEYRLATQQQWLFFAKDTNDKDAVISAGALAKAGSKPANPRGLCDVRGNVWEWLADSDGANAPYIGAAYNTRLATSLEFGKVEQRARTFKDKNVGFRVVLIPSQ
jgi:formylglycine-generating enzyme required for sulfatase activity